VLIRQPAELKMQNVKLKITSRFALLAPFAALRLGALKSRAERCKDTKLN